MPPVLHWPADPVQKAKSKKALMDGETNLLIMSIRSGIGVDGPQIRAPWIVIGELDWSKAVHLQNIGRGDRDGNPDPESCGAVYVTTEYGSDPVMLSVLGVKSDQGRGIQDPNSDGADISITSQLHSGRFKELAQNFLTNQGVQVPTDLLSHKTGEQLASLF